MGDQSEITYHSTVRALHRRRQTKWRLPVLDCGCADPWPCRCYDPPPSEKMVAAAVNTAQHLFDCGLTPILGIETRRALWQHGGAYRRLAERLHRACGGSDER